MTLCAIYSKASVETKVVELQSQSDSLETPENPGCGLSKVQTQHLECLMLEKRAELASNITRLHQLVTLKEDCSLADAAEAASLCEEAHRANAVANEYQRTVEAIDLALARLKRGGYGISEETGDPISYERLKVIPWATSVAGVNSQV